MRLPPQLNFITLACADVERMATFFRALGWPEAPGSEPAHRVFQCTNGVALALYARRTTSRTSARGPTASAAARSA